MADRERIQDDLRHAEQAFARAHAAAEANRRHRNYVVRLALGEGLTHAEVAEATGLSRGRVGQIASRRQ